MLRHRTHPPPAPQMSLLRVATAAAVAVAASAAPAHHRHEGYGPLNKVLGVHGYPDCVPGPEGVSDDVERNQMTMRCAQKKGAATALAVACVGDSITAGAHSSGPTMTYPAQLQAMLDPAAYTVTNLGACGSTMQKHGDS